MVSRSFLNGVICFIIITFVMIFSVGCSKTAAPTQNQASQETLTKVSQQPIAWQSDGKISDDEYTQVQQIGELQVFDRLSGEYVMFGMRAKSKGYIAVGISPENKMQGADVIIGTTTNGTVNMVDSFATGQFGPHPADTVLGGSSDLLDASGSSDQGWITLEFKRKLKTGDSKDKDLVVGDNKVIWSTGGTTDLTVHHDNRGYGVLTLKQ